MNRLLVCMAVGMLVLFSACTTKKKDVSQGSEKGDIVLIINDIPVNYRYYRSGNSGRYAVIGGNHEIGYYAHGFIPSEFHPDYTRDKDTIVIKSVSGALEIEHKYKGLDVFSFIAQPNDTLYFSYKDNMPVVRCSREGKKHDYDYEALIRKEVYEGNYSAYTLYDAPFFLFFDYKKYGHLKGEEAKKMRVKSDRSFKAKQYPIALSQFDKEEKLLDSLIANDYLSGDVAEFYKGRMKYRRMRLEILKNKSGSFKYFEQNAELFKYSYYRKIVETIFNQEILNNIDFKKPLNYFNFCNSGEVYDAIQKAVGADHETKKYMSFSWFPKIVESSTNEEITRYFNAFKSAYGEAKDLVANLIEEHNLNQEVTENINLIDKEGIKTTFKEVMAKHKGKIVYVDFWASGCGPCRREMPSSHKLKEEYRGKDVVFVYLSFRDNEKAWRRALKPVQLEEEKNSYMITNCRTSKSLEKMNIERIPRFMIFGRDGKVMQQNAPRPSSKEIRKVLNDCMKG